jgi:hypothetical protein
MFAVTFDWQSREFYTYLAVAGAVVIALSVGVYAVPGNRLKVPGIALSIVGGLGAGIALGVIFMGAMGCEIKKMDDGGNSPPPDGARGGPPPMMMGRGGPGGPGGGGPPMMGGFGGGRGGPSSKVRLAQLVNKLDVLTEKPLTVQLNDEQRKEIQGQLTGLADAEELTDDDAKERLDRLQEVLKGHKATFEAAGYVWPREGGGNGPPPGAPGGPPAGGGGRGGQQPPNPFKAEQNADHLKRLTERLDKPVAARPAADGGSHPAGAASPGSR